MADEIQTNEPETTRTVPDLLTGAPQQETEIERLTREKQEADELTIRTTDTKIADAIKSTVVELHKASRSTEPIDLAQDFKYSLKPAEPFPLKDFWKYQSRSIPPHVRVLSEWKKDEALLNGTITGVTIEKRDKTHRVELQIQGSDGSTRFLGLGATVDSRTGFKTTLGDSPAEPENPNVFTPRADRPSELAGNATDVKNSVDDVLAGARKMLELGAAVSIVSSNPQTA